MGKQSRDEEVPFGEQKEKPWGYERPLAEFKGLFLKELFFRKGKSSSQHYHEKKDEFFYIVKGQVRVLLADKELVLAAGDTLHISPGQEHRIEPIQDTLILELGTRMFGDVIRVADDYDRARRE
ncbi:MAG: cupin domain-containing protein [Candidatus Hermodarchaeota archaeon]|jgi:mannose-6-phosphate isomerase|nr:cupin domain-containing protein [Candidatus Hermodarchaeota archaeon]